MPVNLSGLMHKASRKSPAKLAASSCQYASAADCGLIERDHVSANAIPWHGDKVLVSIQPQCTAKAWAKPLAHVIPEQDANCCLGPSEPALKLLGIPGIVSSSKMDEIHEIRLQYIPCMWDFRVHLNERDAPSTYIV